MKSVGLRNAPSRNRKSWIRSVPLRLYAQALRAPTGESRGNKRARAPGYTRKKPRHNLRADFSLLQGCCKKLQNPE